MIDTIYVIGATATGVRVRLGKAEAWSVYQ